MATPTPPLCSHGIVHWGNIHNSHLQKNSVHTVHGCSEMIPLHHIAHTNLDNPKDTTASSIIYTIVSLQARVRLLTDLKTVKVLVVKSTASTNTHHMNNRSFLRHTMKGV